MSPLEKSPGMPQPPKPPEKPKPAPVPVEKPKPPETSKKEKTPTVADNVAKIVYEGTSKESHGGRPAKEGTLRAALDAIAGTKGKTYTELPIVDKLSALNEHLQNSGVESPRTSEAIARIQEILQEKPNPGQIDQIKRELARLPELEDASGLQFEIQEQIKGRLVGYAAEHQEEFHKRNDDGSIAELFDVNEFAREINATEFGQTQTPDFHFYDTAQHYRDLALESYLKGQQTLYTTLDYDRNNPASIDQEIYFLRKAQDELMGTKAFDKAEVGSVLKNLNNQIVGLEGLKARKEAEAYAQRMEARDLMQSKNRDLSQYPPRDAEDLVRRADDEMGQRYQINAEDVSAAYNRLPSPEEREAFVWAAKRKIRAKLEELEEFSEPFRLGNVIDKRIQAIATWLDVIKNVNPGEWESIHNEAEARQWLHEFYQTLRQGSSPMDTKSLMQPMQEFDKIELREAITHLPGVWKAHQLLERDYDQLLAAETNPFEWKRVYNGIIDEISKAQVPVDPMNPDSPLKPLIDKREGISARTAVEVAYRHYHETGRDAQRYALYMEKNDCVRMVYKERKGWRGALGQMYATYEVDPHAPQLWNAFRLTYYSKAMWSFFQFGANMEGEMKNITVQVPDGRGGFHEKQFGETKTGQGVGADAMVALLANGYSSCITDFYSRRIGYIVNGWVDDQVRKEQRILAENPDHPMKAEWEREHKLYMQNKNKIKGTEEFEKAKGEYKAYLYKRGVEFCIENQIPVMGVPGGKDLEKIKEMYPAAVARAEAHEAQMKTLYGEKYRDFYKNGSVGIIPSMEHMDIRSVPWGSILRNQENVRGNFRDHFSALQVNDVAGKFINDPTLPNFEAFDWHLMTSYTTPNDAQVHFVLPGYLTLRDMNRGKGMFGGEGPFRLGKSKLGQVRGVPAMSEKELYEVGKWAVANGGLTDDMLKRARSWMLAAGKGGEYVGRFRDWSSIHWDFYSSTYFFLTLLGELKKDIEKDSK